MGSGEARFVSWIVCSAGAPAALISQRANWRLRSSSSEQLRVSSESPAIGLGRTMLQAHIPSMLNATMTRAPNPRCRLSMAFATIFFSVHCNNPSGPEDDPIRCHFVELVVIGPGLAIRFRGAHPRTLYSSREAGCGRQYRPSTCSGHPKHPANIDVPLSCSGEHSSAPDQRAIERPLVTAWPPASFR